MVFETENTINASVGDKVIIEFEAAPLEVSFIIYGIPSLLVVAGIFAGYFIFRSELAGLAIGLCLFAVYFPFLRYVLRLNSKRYSPRIRVVKP
jgi:positive regulator of sigma E activity